jgi:hypothetical protein
MLLGTVCMCQVFPENTATALYYPGLLTNFYTSENELQREINDTSLETEIKRIVTWFQNLQTEKKGSKEYKKKATQLYEAMDKIWKAHKSDPRICLLNAYCIGCYMNSLSISSEMIQYYLKLHTMLEYSISNNPVNVDARYFRLMININTPGDMRSDSQMEEDAKIILANFPLLPSDNPEDYLYRGYEVAAYLAMAMLSNDAKDYQEARDWLKKIDVTVLETIEREGKGEYTLGDIYRKLVKSLKL